MEQIEQLGDITRLSEHVVRILGQNPGKFTLQGTNTYLIGTQNPYILVDTAEGKDSYIPLLASALEARSDPSKPDISDIIISHWHHDHVGGIPSVLSLLKKLWVDRNGDKPYTPPRLHKYPASQESKGGHTTEYNQLPKLLAQISADQYIHPPTGSVFHDLVDGQTIRTADGSTVFRVLHTPGHTVDSICLYVPQDKALYTADTVLGHGTAVFEDLATYLASLNKMLHFGSPSHSHDSSSSGDIDLEYVSLYPAHGAVVTNGRETISTYIKHRLEREEQVLAVLRSSVPEELRAESQVGSDPTLWTTWNLVRVIYKSYPENLWLPAARGIDLHLKKLESDGALQHAGGEGVESRWRLVSPPRSPSL
ncbi:lactamase [Agrocybe pediades]|nr:lactamase [Agrocybe pediades]